ncbi:hypothetical protein [Streptomyces massasporeus]
MNAPSAHLGAPGSGHTAEVTADLCKRGRVAGHAAPRRMAIRTAAV